jgi:hypothetical protein
MSQKQARREQCGEKGILLHLRQRGLQLWHDPWPDSQLHGAVAGITLQCSTPHLTNIKPVMLIKNIPGVLDG